MLNLSYVTALAGSALFFAVTMASANTSSQNKSEETFKKPIPLLKIQESNLPTLRQRPSREVIGTTRKSINGSFSTPRRPVFNANGRPCLPETDGNCHFPPDPVSVWSRHEIVGERLFEGTAYDDGWIVVCRESECGSIEGGAEIRDPGESTSIGEAVEALLIETADLGEKTEEACTGSMAFRVELDFTTYGC